MVKMIRSSLQRLGDCKEIYEILWRITETIPIPGTHIRYFNEVCICFYKMEMLVGLSGLSEKNCCVVSNFTFSQWSVLLWHPFNCGNFKPSGILLIYDGACNQNEAIYEYAKSDKSIRPPMVSGKDLAFMKAVLAFLWPFYKINRLIQGSSYPSLYTVMLSNELLQYLSLWEENAYCCV